MKRFGLALLFSLLIGAASAQLNGGLMFPGPGTPHSAGGGGGFSGVIDVFGATNAKWCFSLRACSAATRGTRAINLCEPTQVTCADISTDATTGALNAPGTIGGTNCTTSNTCIIKKWYDQLVLLACAGGTSCDLDNGSIGPSLTYSCSNSHPCAAFNGSQKSVATNGFVAAGGANGTFVAVANRTPSSSNFMGLVVIGSFGLAWANSASNALLFGSSTTATFAAPDAQVNSLVGIFNGASSIGYANNSAGVTGLSPGGGTLSGSLALGQLNGAGFQPIGQIMEVAFYDSTSITSGNATSYYGNAINAGGGFW